MVSSGFFAGNSELRTRNILWYSGCVFVTGIAIFLRFFWLALKPLHHDEGVNGHFLIRLLRESIYQYDPANYHGPDLYYLSLAFVKVFGLNTISIRSSVAIFGVLTVILAFFLHRYLGKVGSLTAGLFLALSPGMVYISRYFIHEILFVFFTLSFVVAIVYFIDKRKAGLFSIAWMVLLLLISFLPSALSLASILGGKNVTVVWIVRVIMFAIEAVLIYFLMRMLLSWDEGRPIYFLLASASASLLFATKETAFITLGTMLIACVSVWAWQKIASIENLRRNWFTINYVVQGALLIAGLAAGYIFFDRLRSFHSWFYLVFVHPEVPDQKFLFYTIIFLFVLGIVSWAVFFLDSKKGNGSLTSLESSIEPSWVKFKDGLADRSNMILLFFAAGIVFAYVGILFFSSFFTYPKGIIKAFEAYAIWTKTGSADHINNGSIAYFKWLMQIESPLIILATIGTFIACFRAKHRVAMFTGLWALGLFLAYTIIPYKTPWLALSFTLPMCLIAGYGINSLAISKNLLHKGFAGSLASISVFVLLYQTYDLNFVRYDSDRMPYVYAHTQRDFLGLIKEIDHYAKKSYRGKEVTIEIVSPDYWAMPWYTRDYKAANYHGKFVDANTAEMIVASDAQRDELEGKYGAHYKYVGTYPLRPGVHLYLLVRRNLADSNAKEISEIPDTE